MRSYSLILLLLLCLLVSSIEGKNKKKSKEELENEKLRNQIPTFMNSLNGTDITGQKDQYKKELGKKRGPNLIQKRKGASKHEKKMIDKANDRIKKQHRKNEDRDKHTKHILEGDWKIDTKEFYEQIRLGAGSACRDLANVVRQPDTQIPYTAVRDCYWSFKSSGQMRQKTLDSVFGLLQLYVFTYDSLKETGYFVVDILDRIRQLRFRLDWQFHEAVYMALVPFFDGHLEYRPTCYRQFTFMQPLFMTGVVGAGDETRIYLHSVDKWENVGLKKFEGAEITKINGKRAIDVIQEYADNEFGKSKSPFTRFNRCLAFSYWDSVSQSFMFDRGAFARRTKLPEQGTVEYEMVLPNQPPQTISVPWFVSPAGRLKFSDAESYFRGYCASNATQVVPRIDVVGEKLHGVLAKLLGNSKLTKVQGVVVHGKKGKGRKGRQLVLMGGLKNDKPKPEDKEKAEKPAAQAKASVPQARRNLPYTLVAQAPGLAFFTLEDQQPPTGILLIQSFASGSLEQWTKGFMAGFQQFMKRGIKKIILDLSNNGGGKICFSYLISALFDRNPNAPFPIPNKPFLSAVLDKDIFQDIANWAVKHNDTRTSFLPTRFLDPSTYKRYGDKLWKTQRRWFDKFSAWITGNRNKYMTGFSGQKAAPKIAYSRYLVDDCSMPKNNPLATLRLPWGKDDIAILSNGYCGSACAMTAAQLQVVKGVKAVFVGAQKVNIARQPRQRAAPRRMAAGRGGLAGLFGRKRKPKGKLARLMKRGDDKAKFKASKKPSSFRPKMFSHKAPSKKSKGDKKMPSSLKELFHGKNNNQGNSAITETCMVFTFPGGQLTTSEELFRYTRKIKSKHAPPQFPSSASMSFTYRKLYSGKKDFSVNKKDGTDIALEYTAYPATHAIGFNPASVMRPHQVWKDAAVALGWRQPEKTWSCERDENGRAVGPMCKEKDMLQDIANHMPATGAENEPGAAAKKPAKRPPKRPPRHPPRHPPKRPPPPRHPQPGMEAQQQQQQPQPQEQQQQQAPLVAQQQPPPGEPTDLGAQPSQQQQPQPQEQQQAPLAAQQQQPLPGEPTDLGTPQQDPQQGQGQPVQQQQAPLAAQQQPLPGEPADLGAQPAQQQQPQPQEQQQAPLAAQQQPLPGEPTDLGAQPAQQQQQ